MDRPGNKNVAITARYLCGAHIYRTTVPESALPLKAVCRHCDSCRRQTEGLYFADTVWPPCLDDPAGDGGVDLARLNKYSFSKNINPFSCATCSSILSCRSPHPGGPFCVFVGTLDAVPGLDRLVVHTNRIFVGNTLDGGVSTWLQKDGSALDGAVARRWRARRGDGKSEKLFPDWPASEGCTSQTP